MTTAFLSKFYEYQRRWLLDPAPFKFGLWARQTGKDFTCAAEAVLDCMRSANNAWLIIACGERQARESLEKAKTWAAILRDEPGCWDADCTPPQFEEKAGKILFENGSRIVALPAKAATVRGYSANVILTEFAFHEDPEGIWQAIYPTVSNPLRGGEKKFRIISTPNGQGNFFHQLWTDSQRFSKHVASIHEAFDDGLPIDVGAMKEGILNPESWSQEYECHFLDQSSVLLPYELIEQCESPEATETAMDDSYSNCRGEIFIGIDFGRRRDMTVCWVLERVGTELWTREVLVLRRCSTPSQLEKLLPRVRRSRRTCVDYTGAGVGLGDSLAQECGAARNKNDYAGKVELCTFTSALKEEIYVKLRASFERRSVWIPHQPEIRDDLHAVHQVVSKTGNISYRAAHTADGHSDRCAALALALRAAESMPTASGATSIGSGFRSCRG